MTRPAVPRALPPGWGLRPPALEVLVIGERSFDVADEAVVLGRLPSAGGAPAAGGEDLVAAARALVAGGASLVEVALPPRASTARVSDLVGTVVAGLDVPVVVAAGAVEAAQAALASGAAAVVPTAYPSEGLLAVVASSSRTVILPVDGCGGADAPHLAEAAAAVGLPPEHVLVEVTAPIRPSAGSPLVTSDPPGTVSGSDAPRDRGRRSAAFALAIAAGARLVRTSDTRTARRTSVALAAIVRAGSARHRRAG